MALEMDAGGVVQKAIRYRLPPPPRPQQYKVYLLRTAPPPLMGENPFQGLVERVGPENRDNLVINSDM
jgi:hypothetical protein